jgi:hypothetical protein
LKEDDENPHLPPKCYLLPLAPPCTRKNHEHEQNFPKKQQTTNMSKITNKTANNTNRSVKKSKIMNKITNMNVNRNVIIKNM